MLTNLNSRHEVSPSLAEFISTTQSDQKLGFLKRAKSTDIPVEQPMQFEFVINLKTAKQIGVTIEPNVLARADKVIK
jgi:hypothetical protein